MYHRPRFLTYSSRKENQRRVLLFTDESSYTNSLGIGSETVEEWIDLNENEGMKALLLITMNRSSLKIGKYKKAFQ